MEILQSCAKPTIYSHRNLKKNIQHYTCWWPGTVCLVLGYLQAQWRASLALVYAYAWTSTVTVVKRTRVPAGYLVKMATDADVDSGRKRTLIQSVEAYIWNVLSGKIHGGIRNIQCKSRLRGTFHRCTIAPRKNIFWRGCFVFMFCRCRGYLYFFTRVPGIFTRVPVLYKGAWFVSHFHHRVCHRTLVAQTRQQTCEQEFCDEELCFMSEQLRYIHLILCEIAGTS